MASRLPMFMARENKADADIANFLTMDDARRIAANTASLPVYLGTDVDQRLGS